MHWNGHLEYIINEAIDSSMPQGIDSSFREGKID